MVLIHAGKETVLELADQAHEHSLSLFIPTHRRGKQVLEGQDQIAFKNHLQNVRQKLKDKVLRQQDIDALMEPLEALLEDPGFWRHQQEGLAVFRNPDYFAVFHSPMPLEDSYRLDARFHVHPLLPFVQPFPEYYLLQIGKKDVSLYQANPFSIQPVAPHISMPSGLEAVTKYYDFEEELQGRTRGPGGMAALYTSDDSDNKEKDHLLADYFRKVDEVIKDEIGTKNVPLVLASVAYYQPIYRQINSYPHLLEEGITGNFDHVQPGDMHQMANDLLEDRFVQARSRRMSQYQQSVGSGLTSSDLPQILEAAVMGRIEVLFLRTDAERWGRFNPETLNTTVLETREPDSESLIDTAALLTLRQGGDVYVLEEMEGLNEQPDALAAALFRF
ncbi:hypothetical protein ACO2Q8_08365 [Larkinella sp. VNQ87]|uniref:baeRF7 domain-containing protein n=1 Tax=Larkinella sp. VNQ87 TaxID=3400921 RepID=UPI003C0ECB9D